MPKIGESQDMVMETTFEYYAFISYKREDEKWAKWLQGKLEGYRLPATVRKEIPRLPKQIRPIFRDKTDLGAGILTASLANELEKSRYLIIICSPLSAQSEWVGKEIVEFVKMGRTDHIIPFIVDGEPNSNNERECFHPVIKEEIPDVLGININELGKQQAFIKVAAKLLDLRFDVLWNRFLREQRKQRVIAAVTGLLFLVGTGFIWDYFFRTKVEYYADYVDRWGIPEGVVKLDKSEVKKRNNHYRFEFRKRILRQVVHANSAGTPVEHIDTEHRDRFAIQVLSYTDNYLSNTEMKTAQGKTIVSYLWGGVNHDKIDIRDTEGNSIALPPPYTYVQNLFYTARVEFVLGIDGQGSYTAANIRHLELKRNDKGYITHKLFKRSNGENPASDANGIWGFEYKLDDLGRPFELHYLGYANKKFFSLPDKTGVMGQKYEYDEKYGNISRTEYFGKDNKPVLNKHGWAMIKDESNSDGNIVKRLYLRDDGSIQDEVIWKYDEKNGNRIEEANSEGGWIAEYDDKRGLMIKREGNPGIMTRKYDDSGNVTEEAYFEMNGEPIRNYYNEDAKWTAIYENGNMVELSFFDTDGEYRWVPGLSPKIKWDYNESGKIKELTFCDNEGSPCTIMARFAKVKYQYVRGNRTEWAYCDEDDNLILLDDGYAKVTVEYDDFGNPKTVAFYGDDDELILCNDGFAKVEYKYTDTGNIEEVTFLGINDERVLYKNEYWKTKLNYDISENLIGQEYFGVDDKRILLKDGYAKVVWVYDDEHGYLKEQAFFGVNDERVLYKNRFTFRKDGRTYYRNGEYWKVTQSYDKHGNVIEEAFLGIDGKLILLEDGFAKVEYKQDDFGNRIHNIYGNAVIEGNFFGTYEPHLLIETIFSWDPSDPYFSFYRRKDLEDAAAIREYYNENEWEGYYWDDY